MVTAVAPAALESKVRWHWLWNRSADIGWTFVPFWGAFVVAGALFASRDWGAPAENPAWNFSVAGTEVHLLGLVMYFYGPLVDAPHLFATIARTYTDRDEWKTRRRLLLGSLSWFLIGPAVILLPYVVRGWSGGLGGHESAGWVLWSNFFAFYALFHINKQHWGFVSLYKRKNGDAADARENRADQLFFFAALWLPYAAMLTAPWYTDFDGRPFSLLQAPLGDRTLGAFANAFCHGAFFAACAMYGLFQFDQWKSGAARNGPKLAYLATIVPLYYVTFSLHPLLAAFWVLLTGVGHCAQYHRVVWAYGKAKYAGKAGDARRLPALLFEHVGVYAGFGVLYGLLTLQGPGASFVKARLAGVLAATMLTPSLHFLMPAASLDLGLKIAAAFIGGVRLHHFYVDSKIWRVSKSPALAQNLNV